MRRIARTDTQTQPPPLLIDYRAWCAHHRRRAYGIASSPDAMREARASWEAWVSLRETWARQHSITEIDVPLADDSDEPWGDEMHAGAWSSPYGGAGLVCRAHGLRAEQH